MTAVGTLNGARLAHDAYVIANQPVTAETKKSRPGVTFIIASKSTVGFFFAF
jgi:hypothetical protein